MRVLQTVRKCSETVGYRYTIPQEFPSRINNLYCLKGGNRSLGRIRATAPAGLASFYCSAGVLASARRWACWGCRETAAMGDAGGVAVGRGQRE
jgi:hypothetical protein